MRRDGRRRGLQRPRHHRHVGVARVCDDAVRAPLDIADDGDRGRAGEDDDRRGALDGRGRHARGLHDDVDRRCAVAMVVRDAAARRALADRRRQPIRLLQPRRRQRVRVEYEERRRWRRAGINDDDAVGVVVVDLRRHAARAAVRHPLARPLEAERRDRVVDTVQVNRLGRVQHECIATRDSLLRVTGDARHYACAGGRRRLDGEDDRVVKHGRDAGVDAHGSGHVNGRRRAELVNAANLEVAGRKRQAAASGTGRSGREDVGSEVSHDVAVVDACRRRHADDFPRDGHVGDTGRVGSRWREIHGHRHGIAR
mmetsp:Transcript_2642/g.9174  ORF Transcript_2642/g.9174 Transcript_2642/m.9174 type:complete len:312 (+) Transcript_2642:5781-6716(+)